MDFMRMLTDNFWTMVVLLLFIISIVSIVLGIFLEAYKTSIKAGQKRMELRNEELRLRLMLDQQKREDQAGSPPAKHSLAKAPSWEEQSQISYGIGCQPRC